MLCVLFCSFIFSSVQNNFMWNLADGFAIDCSWYVPPYSSLTSRFQINCSFLLRRRKLLQIPTAIARKLAGRPVAFFLGKKKQLILVFTGKTFIAF